jgi:hypothetical protein
VGADFIGFRSCPLQRELGQAGFVQKLKLLMYKRAAEAAVPDPERREALRIRATFGHGRAAVTTYAEIRTSVTGFEEGIPECPSCPLSGGHALGCHASIAFPITAALEEDIFRIVIDSLSVPGSPGDRFYREIIARFDDLPTDWIERRGAEPGFLASRDAPCVHRWEENGAALELSSADVLASIFCAFDDDDDVRLQCEVLVMLAEQAEQKDVEPALADVARLARAIIAGPPDWKLLVDA